MVRLVIYLANFLALMIVLPCHEFAHAFAAVKCGDDTPKYSGRYTLNPFAHFDPLGLVCLIFLRFGWAKPVPINPSNFRDYKKGSIWVSIAGVLTNLLFAFFICPITLLATEKFAFYIEADWGKYINVLVYHFFWCLFYMNMGLFVFNLLPLYPLDGFRLYDALNDRKGRFYFWLRQNSGYILIALIILGVVADYTGFAWLDVVSLGIEYASKPIVAFWRLIIK